jgi:hypothetical protein
LGLKGKGGVLLWILGIRRNQAYSGVIFDGPCDFYPEFIANRGAVRRLPGEDKFEEKFGYSDIIGQLFPSNEEQRDYLKSFFKGVLPGEAH